MGGEDEIAGPGFINFTLKASASSGSSAMRSPPVPISVAQEWAGSSRIQVEFVSANPTGPLHVGHGRGAAYGASLSSLLSFAGWDVTREYYVNDAGRQMDILGLSTWLRYLEFFNEHVPFPPNGYQGDYVRGMARNCNWRIATNMYARPPKYWLEPRPAWIRPAPTTKPRTNSASCTSTR